MDKSTLSGYGWIVICTLVLVVMLALATPFGDYVGNTVVATVKGYGSANEKAIDEDNIKAKSSKFDEQLGKFGTLTNTEQGATFNKTFNCQNHEDCEDGYHEDDCWPSCKPVTLTWEQLKDTANGTKYGYGTFSISDTSIGNSAFISCESLASIVIPNDVTSIGAEAFEYCTSLTSVTISNSVTSISEGTFYCCPSLKSITIPNSITSIGDSAFGECTSLTEINYQGTQSQWNAIVKGCYWNEATNGFTVHCTDGDIAIPAWEE